MYNKIRKIIFDILMIFVFVAGILVLVYTVGDTMVTDLVNYGFLPIAIRIVVGLSLFIGIIYFFEKRYLNVFIDKNKVIFQLWDILEEINSNLEISRFNSNMYVQNVHRLQDKRWDILDKKFVDALYKRYQNEEMEGVKKDEKK